MKQDLPAVPDDQWEAVRTAVLRVLTDEDVMGLEPGREAGAPADEYAPEATDLTRMFLLDGVVTAEHVQLCWLHWFSEQLDPRVAASFSRRTTIAAWTAFYLQGDVARRSGLRETAAAVLLGILPPGALVAEASCLLDEQPLLDDARTAALVALASLYADATAQDVLDRLAIVLDAEGQPSLTRGSEEAKILALRVACRSLLSGETDLLDFTSWVHARIGHDGPASAQSLVEVDDGLDTRGPGAVTRESEHGARVARLAHEFLLASD